jgi:hypothetical protein
MQRNSQCSKGPFQIHSACQDPFSAAPHRQNSINRQKKTKTRQVGFAKVENRVNCLIERFAQCVSNGVKQGRSSLRRIEQASYSRLFSKGFAASNLEKRRE